MITIPGKENIELAATGALVLDAMLMVPWMRRFNLPPEAFYDPHLAAIVRAVQQLHDGAKPVDMITVADAMKSAGVWRDGYDQIIEQSVSECATVAHGEYYLQMVREKWMLRQVQRAADDIKNRAAIAMAEGQSAEIVCRQAPEIFHRIMSASPEMRSNRAVMDEIITAYEAAKSGEKKAIGHNTPFDQLTQWTCGWEPGLTIIAGRPSAGKTTFEDMCAQTMCEAGLAVARATMDSSHDELMARTIARLSGVSMPKAKFGYARHNQIAAMKEASSTIAEWPMWINSTDRDIRAICSWARMMKSKHDIQALTLDYIQLYHAAELGRTDERGRVSFVSQQLKSLALELKIPILALSQLSREVEKENRKPRLSDLMESGGLEADAHKVIFLFLASDKAKEMEDRTFGSTKKKRPVWLHLMKNKGGATDAMPLWLHCPYFRFVEAAYSADGDAFHDDHMEKDHEDKEEKRDDFFQGAAQ